MSKRTLVLLLVGCLFTAALWAADDPFVGEWKLNPSKSKIIEEMKVESVGTNKYAFDFGGGAETIAADGTDQQGLAGTTVSVTIEGPDSWKVVRKKDGRILLTANWKLSQDGHTLNDDYTEFGPNGSSSNVQYVFKRTAGTSGFVGTWENTSQQMNSVFVLQVRPYEGSGLSFINRAQETTRNIKFDGKDYPALGPNLPTGFASSGRRVDTRTLQLTDKIDGKIVRTQQVELSPDFKTLTMTVHVVRRSEPNILVFDRE